MPANPNALIVDTDIHPGARVDLMLPFLPEPWRTRLRGGNRTSGTLGYWNPGGVNRGDAVTTDGRRIEDYPSETVAPLVGRVRHRLRHPEPGVKPAPARWP